VEPPLRALPLRVTFETGADGRVTGVLIHPPRGQKAIHAERVGANAAPTSGAREREKEPDVGIRPALVRLPRPRP